MTWFERSGRKKTSSDEHRSDSGDRPYVVEVCADHEGVQMGVS